MFSKETVDTYSAAAGFFVVVASAASAFAVAAVVAAFLFADFAFFAGSYTFAAGFGNLD